MKKIIVLLDIHILSTFYFYLNFAKVCGLINEDF